MLVDLTEVFQNVIHGVFHQPLTGVELSKVVNSYTVLYIHVTLHEMTAGLLDSCDTQQV